MSYKCFQLCFNKDDPLTIFTMEMKINQLNYYDFNIKLDLTYNLYIKELNRTLVTMYTISLNYDVDKKTHFFDIKVNYNLEDSDENKLIKIELKELEQQPKIDMNELLNEIKTLKSKVKQYEEMEYEVKEEEIVVTPKKLEVHTPYLCSSVDVVERPNKKKINIENKLITLLNDSSIVPTQLEVVNNDNEDIEEKVYYHLKLISTDTDIKNNITFIIAQLVKFVDNFKIPGFRKKELVISSIHRVLDEQKVDKENIDYMINNLCPEMIDMLISVDRRKTSIKKKSICK